MSQLIVLIRNFLKLAFSRKIRYLVFFIIPAASLIAGILLFGSSTVTGISIGYVNNDSGPMGADLASYIERTGMTRLKALEEEDLRAALVEGNRNLGLVIPEDFSDTLREGKLPAVELLSMEDQSVSDYIASTVNRFVADVLILRNTANNDRGHFEEMYAEYIDDNFAVTVREVKDRGLKNEGVRQGMGFLLYLILLQAMMVSNLILADREKGTYFRIRMAPVREIVYTFGNMAATFFIIALQTVITLVVTVGILKFDLGIALGPLVLILLVFSLTAVGLCIMITSLVDTVGQASLLGNMVLMLTSMLSGCFWPLNFMTPVMQKMAKVLPQSWVLDAIARTQSGDPLRSVMPHLLLLLAFAGLFLSVFAYRMKRERDLG